LSDFFTYIVFGSNIAHNSIINFVKYVLPIIQYNSINVSVCHKSFRPFYIDEMDTCCCPVEGPATGDMGVGLEDRWRAGDGQGLDETAVFP
jgi:hypothetical protein